MAQHAGDDSPVDDQVGGAAGLHHRDRLGCELGAGEADGLLAGFGDVGAHRRGGQAGPRAEAGPHGRVLHQAHMAQAVQRGEGERGHLGVVGGIDRPVGRYQPGFVHQHPALQVVVLVGGGIGAEESGQPAGGVALHLVLAERLVLVGGPHRPVEVV